MATKFAGGYVGPAWPLNEVLTELYPALYAGYLQLQNDLRDEFKRRSEAIAKDDSLSPKGIRDKLRALAEATKVDPRVKAFGKQLDTARQREGEIRRTLTERKPPKPRGADAVEIAAQLVAREFQRHRTLERFQTLSAEAQGRVIWRALDAAGGGDPAAAAEAAAFLSDLRFEARVPGEAGLLDDR
jgi:hypothetical protein